MEKNPTTEQRRDNLKSDETADKRHGEPAASPLGTDDEAGGTTAVGDRVERAREADRKIAEAAESKRSIQPKMT